MSLSVSISLPQQICNFMTRDGPRRDEIGECNGRGHSMPRNGKRGTGCRLPGLNLFLRQAFKPVTGSLNAEVRDPKEFHQNDEISPPSSGRLE